MIRFWGIIIFCIIGLSHCTVNQQHKPVENKVDEKAIKEKGLEVLLEFSKVHQSYYTDVNKPIYTENEISILFSTMLDKSNTVCEMIWGRKKMDKNFVNTFIRKEVMGKKPFDTWGHPLPKLVAGCWNFFRMNDHKPDVDFQVVSKLYPNQKKSCFSVGFLQPYIMHSVMGCESISAIDIDWRIHDGHFQLLQMFKESKLADSKEISKSLADLKLGWIAFEKKHFGKTIPVSISTVCNPAMTKLCNEHITKVQTNYREMKKFRMQLSSLHEADYSHEKNTLPVIYLSNAMDSIYTSKNEFFQFLDSVSSKLDINSKAILIYHVGGKSTFGIYELEKKDKSYTLNTVCKDVYIAVETENWYHTHLDRASSTKKSVKECRKL